MVLKGVIAAGIASWLVTPWLQMARQGTLDQQAVAAWRTEPVRAPFGAPEVAIPAPRSAPSADPVPA